MFCFVLFVCLLAFVCLLVCLFVDILQQSIMPKLDAFITYISNIYQGIYFERTLIIFTTCISKQVSSNTDALVSLTLISHSPGFFHSVYAGKQVSHA